MFLFITELDAKGSLVATFVCSYFKILFLVN